MFVDFDAFSRHPRSWLLFASSETYLKYFDISQISDNLIIVFDFWYFIIAKDASREGPWQYFCPSLFHIGNWQVCQSLNRNETASDKSGIHSKRTIRLTTSRSRNDPPKSLSFPTVMSVKERNKVEKENLKMEDYLKLNIKLTETENVIKLWNLRWDWLACKLAIKRKTFPLFSC